MINFQESMAQVWGMLRNIRVSDVLDIFLVAALFYVLIGLMRRTTANKVFQGIVLILLLLGLSEVFRLYTLNFILRNTVQLGLLALVILFQPELRRLLENIGTGRAVARLLGRTNSKCTESAITQVVMACEDLAESKTGALIIFEREDPLDQQIRTGTVIDADTTAELLKNIFFNKAPLHDGAVIMRGGRIQAAGCMLPLSQNSNLSKDLGMRHRAGIGMSEASDALVAIVSEETGAISVAADGVLKRHLSTETLDKLLHSELMCEEEESESKWSISRLWGKGKKDE